MTVRALRASSRLLIIIGLAVVCRADVAFASSFTVNPTLIELSARTPTATLLIRNESPDTLRFQLAVMAWDQKPDGEMALTETEDLAFFPTLFTIPPKQDRRVRIGTRVPFGTTEKSYRILVKELPSDEKAAAPGVNVITHVSVPIFLRPPAPKAAVSLTNVGLKDGRVQFDLQNIGNMRVLPRSAKITGFGASGNRVFSSDLQGWYVLAAGVRHFSLDLEGGECRQVRRLEIEIAFESTTLKERLDTPGGVCRS